jgi:aminopeptidase N
VLTQERFVLNYPNAPALEWRIPVTFAVTNALRDERISVLGKEPLRLELKDCAAPLKANVGAIGYFRVAYDAATLAALIEAARSLPETERLNLLNDTWALTQGGHAPAADFFALLEKIAPSERGFAVWDAILWRLASIDELHRGAAGREQFRVWARRLVEPQFANLGWEKQTGEPELAGVTRAACIEALGTWGDEAILAEARRRFEAFLADPTSLPGDLRRAVFRVVGQHADAALYEKLHERARTEVSTQTKNDLYRGLAAGQPRELAEKTLAIALTPERVPTEAARMPRAVAEEGEHVELAWQFAVQHIKALSEKIGPSQGNEILPHVAAHFSDAGRADELEATAKRLLPDEARIAVARAADDIRFRAEFKARLIPQTVAWLDRKK